MIKEINETERYTCEYCGKATPDVRKRLCGYSQEIHGTDVVEVICDDCEHEHLINI